VFFLNYDENDGFHVPPPVPPPGTRDEFVGGLPIGLGFRVPMVVISPWSTGGFACGQVFDHTSLIRFIEWRFGLFEPNISAWRQRTCGDLTATFDFDERSRRLPTLPDPSGSAPVAQQQCATLPAPNVPSSQVLPSQEPGRRPRRRVSR
jgi:phospholipase C